MRKRKDEPKTDTVADVDCTPFYMAETPAPADGEMTPGEAAEALAMLAAVIRNDGDFRRVLLDTDPKLREQVYNEIRPYVGYPDPRPFALFNFDADA